MRDRSFKYRMLGRCVSVTFDSSPGASILREELSLYPKADDASPADLSVHYAPVPTETGRLVNPGIHDELGDAFVMRDRMATVRFNLDGSRLTGIDLHPRSSTSGLIRQVRRMLDMQYSSREERAGVIFHELGLVPAAHWMADLAVVHGAAFSDPDGRVTLVGGTGGAGKTSLALELCMRHGFRFAADDMAFVDRTGHVWPNLAHPKIYAYNLEDNPDLADRVLSPRGVADRLHWTIHRRRGPQFVRRRVPPDVLYGAVESEGGPLHRYVLLAREDRPDIFVSTVTPERCAAMTVSIIQAEYSAFHRHLHWHAFNRAVTGRPPSVAVPELAARWRATLLEALAGATCLLVRVPLSMPHARFKDEVADLVVRGE